MSNGIAVLVSGGVDSSVALALLKEQGKEVTAFYLKIWLEDELAHLGSCPWEEDLSYVRAVCEQLEVPLRIINLQQEYWDRVVSYAVREIKAGRTPNPDIMCNKQIKFGAFFDYVLASHNYIASGHYARVEHRDDGSVVLCTSPDLVKDQTYFLSQMTQEQLQRCVFPIGHLTKKEVRALAQRFSLPNKDRKDSQGICFLGSIKFNDFIKHYCGQQQGDLVDVETGVKVGTHQGFFYFTPGQRQGIKLAGGPWYVVRKDPAKNIVYISRSYYAPDKKRTTFTVTDCNWINALPSTDLVQVKIRHGAQRHEACISVQGDGCYSVVLTDNDQGLASGQFAAFYQGDICLGSGVIETQDVPSSL